MRLAFGRLCLTPDDFWRMSPVELQAMLDGYLYGGSGADGPLAMARGEMSALCAQYPDTGVEHVPNG